MEEFGFVEHLREDGSEPIFSEHGEQTSRVHTVGIHVCNARREFRAVLDEPFEATFEIGNAVEELRLQRLDGE